MAVFVQVRGAERDRIAEPELEDVPDLDRRLDPDRGAVDRVARLHRADVDGLEAEIATGLDAAQVQVGPVRAGDVVRAGAGRYPLVEQDWQPMVADGADRARRAEALLDLRLRRGAVRLGERESELDLVHAVIAAEHHELHLAAVGNDRERLEQRAGCKLEMGRDCLDRGHSRG